MSFDYDELVLAPCVDAFGEVAQGYPIPVYTPIGGAQAFRLDGIFDDAYRPLDTGTALEVVSRQPRLGVRLSGFPAGVEPREGDRWQIRGVTYAVRKIELDGKGEAGLLLNVD